MLFISNRKLHCEVREKTNKMQQLDVYYQYFLNMFRVSLCPSSGEQDMCYCMWCAARFTTHYPHKKDITANMYLFPACYSAAHHMQ